MTFCVLNVSFVWLFKIWLEIYAYFVKFTTNSVASFASNLNFSQILRPQLKFAAQSAESESQICPPKKRKFELF